MVGEKDKPKLTVEQRLEALEREKASLWFQVNWMQQRGGFTDAKTLSLRCGRIEDRLEHVEGQGEALLDVAAFNVVLLEDHLQDRHDADLSHDNSIDVVNFRRIRKRLHVWAEKVGLLKKKQDLREVRTDENRIHPRAAVRAS
jgi:hypothetical protein